MEERITKQIGRNKYEFIFEGNTPWECQYQAEKLSFGDLQKCGICGSDRIRLNAYKTKEGFKYLCVKCAECRGKLTLGIRQDDGSVYFRRNEDRSLQWEQYNPENATSTAPDTAPYGGDKAPSGNNTAPSGGDAEMTEKEFFGE